MEWQVRLLGNHRNWNRFWDRNAATAAQLIVQVRTEMPWQRRRGRADATLMTESGFWAKEGILVRKFDLLFQLNVATFPKKIHNNSSPWLNAVFPTPKDCSAQKLNNNIIYTHSHIPIFSVFTFFVGLRFPAAFSRQADSICT